MRRIGGQPVSATDRGRPAPLSPAPARRSGPGRVLAIVIGALILVGAVAALLIATSGSGTPSRTGSTATSNSATKRPRTVAFNPATVTVAVLNGTATNDLAHRVSNRLTAAGYRQGTIATASDQTRTATTVAFLPGFRRDALHVASSLGLGPASVRPSPWSTPSGAKRRGIPCSCRSSFGSSSKMVFSRRNVCGEARLTFRNGCRRGCARSLGDAWIASLLTVIASSRLPRSSAGARFESVI